MTSERRSVDAAAFEMGVDAEEGLEGRRRRCTAVADAEVVRLGVRRMLEALDWLGERTEGRLETWLGPIELVGGPPSLEVLGMWWPREDGPAERLEDRTVPAASSKARMLYIARDMLHEFDRRSGRARPDATDVHS